jgi:hypothetical protein
MLPLATAADVCRRFKLSPPASALLTPDVSPPAFFDALLAAGHLADARRLLAHALPPHRAVWWATLCLHHSDTRAPLAAAERDALLAAGRWCLAPSEATRRAAKAAGRAAGQATTGGVLGLAAFLSGGSMSRPGLPAVLPEPHLCGRLCGVVVYLSSVRFEPARYKQHLRDYLDLGRAVARGDLLTPVPDPVPDDAPVPAAPGDADLAERLAAFLAGGKA